MNRNSSVLKHWIFFLLFVALAAAAAIPRIRWRIGFDKKNLRLWVCVHGPDFEDAVRAAGDDLAKRLTSLPSIGVNAYAIVPRTLEELVREGQVKVEHGGVTTAGGPAWTVVRSLDPKDPYGVRATLAALVETKTRGGGVRFRYRGRLLWKTKAFFNRATLALVKKVGLQPVFRLANGAWAGRPHLRRILSVMEGEKRPIVVFDEKEALGYAGELRFVARELARIGATVGQVEFSGQRGVKELVSLGSLQAIIVHSIPDKEMAKYGAARIYARWARAARERNVRLLYVRFFPPLNLPYGGGSLVANLSYLRQLGKVLVGQGFEAGIPVHPRPVQMTPVMRVVTLTAAALAVLVLVCWLLSCMNLLPASLLFAGVCLAAALSSVAILRLAPGFFEKVLALGAAILVATLGPIVFYTRLRAYFSRETRPGTVPVVLKTVLELVAFFALQVAGGVLVFTLLSDPAYLLKLKAFSGVKLVYVGPLGLVFAWLIWDLKWPVLRYPIVGRDAVLAGAVLLLGAVYVLRSGNVTGQLVTAKAEYRIRDRLEAVLPARPRTKEFLIGYPALVLAAAALRRRDRIFAPLFLVAGTVAGVSAANTFCHLHSPFLLGVMRGLMGLLCGGAVGVLLLPLYAFIRRRERRYIAILGYAGFGNAGDEWITANLVEAVRPTLKAGEEILVFSGNPEQSAEAFGVEGARRTCPWAVINGLLNARVFVTGPGGIFQDKTGSLSAPFYLAYHVLAALFRVEGIAMVGQSFGSLSSKVMQKAVAMQGLRSDLVVVRDRASQERLARWGCDGETVVLGADAAFWQRPSIQGSPKRLARFGLNLRGDSGWSASRVKALLSGLSEVCKKQNVKPVGILLHPKPDGRFLKGVGEPIGKLCDKVHEIVWPNVLEEFARCRMILAMRYHAVLACLLTDTPFVALEYDSKVSDVLDEYEWPFRLTWKDIEDGKTGAVFADLAKEKGKVLDRMKRMRSDQFERATRAREEFVAFLETNGPLRP